MKKKAALTHTTACLQSSGWPTGLLPSFIIRIDDRDDPSYWLTVLARHGARLSDLDHLLRDVWMESGTEPRAFTIEKRASPSAEKGMEIPLVNLLEQGSSFSYEYGMYIRTNLRLRALGTTPLMPPEGPACLIAQNKPSFPKCSVCGADAECIASVTGKDEDADHYCLTCLMDLDEAAVQLIENSPRKSVCATHENLLEMIQWYPPGWEIPDLVSPEMLIFMMSAGDSDNEEEETFPDTLLMGEDEVDDMITTVFADIGEEFSGFLDEEMTAYGEDMAALSGEIAMGFCTLLYILHDKTCDAWDAPLVRTCLLHEFPMSPTITAAWHDHTVPILCRFLAHIEKCGRISNAAELTRELQDAEPLYQECIARPNGTQEPSDILMERAKPRDADEDAFQSICREIVGELQSTAQNGSPEDCLKMLEGIFGVSLDALREDAARYKMIAGRCDDFCTRLGSEDIPERCREMIFSLTAHPDRPLLRGDDLLWSAAIVYAACREEKILGKAKGGSPLAREISDHFNRDLSSVRSKVTVLRKRLSECPDEEFSFPI